MVPWSRRIHICYIYIYYDIICCIRYQYLTVSILHCMYMYYIYIYICDSMNLMLRIEWKVTYIDVYGYMLCIDVLSFALSWCLDYILVGILVHLLGVTISRWNQNTMFFFDSFASQTFMMWQSIQSDLIPGSYTQTNQQYLEEVGVVLVPQGIKRYRDNSERPSQKNTGWLKMAK